MSYSSQSPENFDFAVLVTSMRTFSVQTELHKLQDMLFKKSLSSVCQMVILH